MIGVALVVVLATACSKKTTTDPDPCALEMVKIGDALVPTLDHPTKAQIAAFHEAITVFAQATMCGPDAAELMRRWDAMLRAPEDAPATLNERREILRGLGQLDEMFEGWKRPPALAAAIEKAKSGAR
jgi:hypothetical protein